ncbi:mannosyl-3-phosphoglycerate phosphatase-related protein [Acerihabitans sp. TG2]|uniref:mannosyl-3-phosphoglycerate phosphatase-related protein n=1 Tax=Acerihabitans sp. TG2 TaxID=3096008 RepID=UPI002B2234E7|nr:mannosyl-3-phosphoglycerate phosphatase-related protein [Acerihabitans sp. TG2]MEA9392630.1 mannosyl-3-phosphoglycerate phosphatase-related protein [Acerihabitans sp. TG2]
MPDLQDPLVVITDLDGSLLDHHTYSWQPAALWLDKLIAAQVPVILCSSKTTAEIVPLQASMGLQGLPFIAENGALVQLTSPLFTDASPIKIRGYDYDTIRTIIQRLRDVKGFRFLGFGDVDEKVIGEWTGLAPQQAMLAQQREASEAFIWRDSDVRLAEFTSLLATEGLSVTQGGRFYHVMSANSSKGAAVRQLLQHFHQQDGRSWRSLGLGDGPNDISMLNEVDYAVIIKGYSNSPMALDPRQQQIYRTTAYGPEGWSEGMDHFITPT